MINKKELQKKLTPEINFHKPDKLEGLAKLLNGKFKKTDLKNIQSNLEFPLKPMETVYELFIAKDFEKLYFLDITRVLYDLKLDKELFYDKKERFILIQEFFNFLSNKSSLKIFIFKIIAEILKNPNHSFNSIVKNNIKNNEFKLIKLCIEKQFSEIYSNIHSKSLSKKLENFGIKHILQDEINEYPNYLINNLINQENQFNSRLEKHYKNNLLEEDINSKELNNKLERLFRILKTRKYSS